MYTRPCTRTEEPPPPHLTTTTTTTRPSPPTPPNTRPRVPLSLYQVCTPIVVAGAPLGSLFGSFLHRLVLAAFVYVTDFAQVTKLLRVRFRIRST